MLRLNKGRRHSANMAAYMRSVRSILDLERQFFAARGTGIVVESRRYVRGLRRKPIRVVVAESETDKVHKETPQYKPGGQSVQSKTDVKPAAHSRRAAQHDFVTAKSNLKDAHVTVTKDQIDGLRYERALPGDKRLGRIVSVARSRTFREHQGKILLEGRRLICDALDAGAIPQMVFFSTADRLRELPLDKLRRATLIKVKFEDIKVWSDLVAPQGVIAIFSRPDPSQMNFTERRHSVPLSLICDNIRDPGNLGTMLRCAAAAGCHDVLLTKGCVDAWEPKVLRAAMGAHFRLPILPSLGWDDIEGRLPNALTVHVADSSRATGEEMADGEVDAPLKPSRAGDYGWVSTRGKNKNVRYEEYDSDSEDEQRHPRVDTQLYHERWAQGPSALVIGGETHGLSEEALRLAEKTGGHRLYIPIVPNVDSLNSAMAASILLFEGRRQLLRRTQTLKV